MFKKQKLDPIEVSNKMEYENTTVSDELRTLFKKIPNDKVSLKLCCKRKCADNTSNSLNEVVKCSDKQTISSIEKVSSQRVLNPTENRSHTMIKSIKNLSETTVEPKELETMMMPKVNPLKSILDSPLNQNILSHSIANLNNVNISDQNSSCPSKETITELASDSVDHESTSFSMDVDTFSSDHINLNYLCEKQPIAGSSDQLCAVNKIVWGKVGTHPWWPAFTLTSEDSGFPAKPGHTWVFWLGEYKISEISLVKVLSFIQAFPQSFSNCKLKTYTRGINEALEILAFKADCNLKESTDLINWAKSGFKTSFILSEFCILPEFVVNHLTRIKGLKCDIYSSELQIKVPSVKENELYNNKVDIFNKVRIGCLNIEDVCICCSAFKNRRLIQHPLYKGGFCRACRVLFKATIFTFGEDGKNICCSICFNEGVLIICDSPDCSRCYCYACIQLLISEEALQKILCTTPWYCFFCSTNDSSDGILQIKSDWKQNLLNIFSQPSHTFEVPSIDKDKKALKVLSVFDGIGTGKYVLDLLGIKVDKYYASEIDEDAINVTKLQCGTSLIHIGDVTKITHEIIKKICPIDLFIGGSPCNDLSLVNPLREGLFDLKGTGQFFFNYVQLLETVRYYNKGQHVFWMFENVAAMSKKNKAIISEYLMCHPVMIDSQFFSPQSRKRYYWGNLPGMDGFDNYWKNQKFQMENLEFADALILDKYVLNELGRRAVVNKIRTVTTQRNSLIQGKDAIFPVNMLGNSDTLWVTELEAIFGFPRHYTDCGNISLSKRRQLLGKTWSVNVIKHLFKPLTFFYKIT